MGSLIGAISSQKVTFHVALFASDGEASIRLYAGTSEYPALPAQAGDNAPGADDQQERPGALRVLGL